MEETILNYVKRVKATYQKGKGNEALTKASLIGPLFTLLGYDLADPDECIPEFKADFGKQRGKEPVDWAFFQNGRLIFLVEAKDAGTGLGGSDAQLADYFGKVQPGVELGILTNGIMWRFFTDNITVHKMDLEPFFVWDVLNSGPSLPRELLDLLEILQRSKFKPDNIETFAEKRHRQSLLVVVLNRLLEPSFDFVRLAITSEVNPLGAPLCSGKITEKVIEHWKEPLADAIHEWARQHVLTLAIEHPNIGAANRPIEDNASLRIENDHASLADLIAAGRVVTPLKIFRKYKGTRLEATLLADATVEFQGQRFESCSGAAEVARATVSGARMNTNGWTFWQYLNSDGRKSMLREARKQILPAVGKNLTTKGEPQGSAHQRLLLKRFWECLVKRPKIKTTRHANITPSEYSWLGAGSGVGGLPFVYVIRQNEGQIALWIDRGDGKNAENKEIFDRIEKNREEIERSFGEKLDWHRHDDKRGCRISYTLPGGGWKSNEADWSGLQDAMIDAMVRFEKAISAYLKKPKEFDS